MMKFISWIEKHSKKLEVEIPKETREFVDMLAQAVNIGI